LALNPDNGELVWYYQHLANDQWDMDWAFERHIIKLPVDGVEKKVIATGGKLALYDLLEARTGRYIASIDLGLQNIVTNIDPETGVKQTNSDLIPGPDRTVMVCPNTAGGKNWHPSAYNPNSRILYVPLMEICMDLIPVGPDASGLLSTGVSPISRPRPDSDGKYGRLQAINLETLEVEWMHRQRAPLSNGVLTTAGGLVFVSDVNRYLAAYDGDNGDKLWQIRLNDVSNVAPITFMVDGKQYIAVTTGRSILAIDRRTVVPEITLPANPAPTLWVFELP
jgi:alcohol dehydrogenase (cytochrome c)